MNVNRKGKEFERAIVRQLKAGGCNARRCYQFRADDKAPDVAINDGLPLPLWIECKSGRLNVARIYCETAKREAKAFGRRACLYTLTGNNYAVPAVVHKSSRTGPALITLSLADLLRLVRR